MMMNLIERQAALNALCEDCKSKYDGLCPHEASKCIEYRAINRLPAIEAEPVRHGRWIALEGWFNKSIVKCSVCGNTLDMDGVNAGRGDANFCPNCGARMYGGADNAAD